MSPDPMTKLREAQRAYDEQLARTARIERFAFFVGLIAVAAGAACWIIAN